MTTSLNQIAAEISAKSYVYNARVWNDRRVYVNLTGRSDRANGDRNLKVYFDSKTGWQIEHGKGYMSDGMIASLNAFRADYNVE